MQNDFSGESVGEHERERILEGLKDAWFDVFPGIPLTMSHG
jgi:hypothetical protein